MLCFCRRAKQQADAHYEHRLLEVSLAAFRRPLDLKTLATACLLRLLNRQLAVAFTAWRQRAAESREVASAAAVQGRRVLLRMQNQLLASAFAIWQQHAARSLRARQVLLRIQLRGLAAALRSWRDWTSRMQRARALMRRSLMGTQQWALAAWREAAAEAAQQRWALQQIAEAEGRMTLVSPKKLMFALRGEPQLALQMQAWAAWRSVAEVQRHLRSQVLRAYKHLYFALAHRCFGILRCGMHGVVFEG